MTSQSCSQGKKMRMVSRRRRQNFLVVSVLFVMGGYVYLGLPFHSSPVMVSPTMRRPLGMFLGVSKVILKREKHVPYLILCVNLHHMQYHGCLKRPISILHVFWEQDNTENLGYLLGLLSFAISWTAKFPFILKAVSIICEHFCHLNHYCELFVQTHYHVCLFVWR